MELKERNVLVIGLGKSGVAATLFLYQQGARVAATDIQPAEKLTTALSALKGLPIRLHLGEHPEWLFDEADLIVLSPGVPKDTPPIRRAVERGVRLIAEVELAASFLRDTIIGITGSNGKTTTTALTAHLLRSAGLEAIACGNIGTPLIDLIPGSHPKRCLAVELSSFQLETIGSFKPRIATVLNVTPDHLDRYPDFEAYKRAKYRVFENQNGDDFTVINADEAHAAEIAAATGAIKVWFGTKPLPGDGVCLENGIITWRCGGGNIPILPAAELSLPGPHNLSNAMAAAAMALLAGAGPNAVARGLRDFPPLEHRLEPAGEVRGIRFVNDSKATNVDSTVVALQSFPAKVHVILGGKDKHGDFTVLNPLLRAHARQVLLIGEAAPVIDSMLEADIPRVYCKNLEEAIQRGYEAAVVGEVVLLAPACASFDMFDNYEHRGREFKRLVRRLADAER